MINLSTIQLLTLWSELDDALCGENNYGGDVAEIYAYTLQSANPSSGSNAPNSMRDKAQAEDSLKAAKSLHSVLALFSEIRDCTITVGGKEFGDWVAKEPFVHRTHITVKRKGV
jgi:hypothetical protein